MAQIRTGKSVTLGLDVGGTKILAGYVNASGEILASKSYPMNRVDQQSALSSIQDAVDDFLALRWQGERPVGMGIGLVGEVDYRRGVWVQAMNIPISQPVPLAEIISAKHGLPVTIDNDVQAATWAELVFTQTPSYSDYVYLNVGTGIAMGIVSEGKLLRGKANYTGEIGHMSVDPSGEICKCGSRGCLENIASGSGMVDRAEALLNKYPDSSLRQCEEALHAGHILDLAGRGDPLASYIRQSALDALGTAVVNTLNLLNPEAVILGGGVLQNPLFVEELKSHVLSKSLPAICRSLSFFGVSRFDARYAGLLGAASLGWR